MCARGEALMALCCAELGSRGVASLHLPAAAAPSSLQALPERAACPTPCCPPLQLARGQFNKKGEGLSACLRIISGLQPAFSLLLDRKPDR